MAARLQDFNVFTAKSLQNREMGKKKQKKNRLLKALEAIRLLALKNSHCNGQKSIPHKLKLNISIKYILKG